ncbi:MAG TPA: PHP domain-containing protein [candidate division Zixibacteria bacterium]|nr:PHP domain-containing protein [candidate division Zixibacteria bacterium]
MKIDLHVHSDHSFDGRTDIESVIKNAEASSLDAVAITDHDTMSAVGLARKYADKVTIIPGMEITTSAAGTHIIGLFLKEEIISRDIDDVIDEIHGQGGLVMIPHPYRAGTGLMYNRDELHRIDGKQASRILSGADLIEAFNYRCTPESLISTDRLLDFHPNLAQTSGSDAHHDYEIGKAYIDLEEVRSGSLEDIKEALLYSPRLLRYEAHTEQGEPETRVTKIKGRKKSLITKTRDFIPRSVRRSLRAIYEKSAGRLSSRRKDRSSTGIRQ